MRNSAVLLIDCPDRKGLVAGVANLLYRYGANITHANQHQDPEAELFLMRVEWDLAAFDLLTFREEFENWPTHLRFARAPTAPADQHQAPGPKSFFMRWNGDLAPFACFSFRKDLETWPPHRRCAGAS